MASALDKNSKVSPRISFSGQRPSAIGAIETLNIPFQPGDVIVGKYRVIRLIGTGGVGFVVSARHIGFDEPVALKFLRPEFATHAEAVTRFTIEARASFKIKSEHVARVLDVDTLIDGTPFIAMELLEGTDLRSLLDRCRMLAIEPAVDYALQTCEALAAAHALHIIHRDIKPENLFLAGPGDETDQIKVLDFGISKVALTGNGRQTSQALTRIAVGTPPYMSPEQVRAASDLDARSDIWSVGCVLYELLTGTAPFDRMSLMQSCAAVLEEEPVPLRDLRTSIPQQLDDVVMRCLHKDPADRYQDVAELAEALAPFGSGRLTTYSERCRAVLNGDGSGRRSTPTALPPVSQRATVVPRVSVGVAARRPTRPVPDAQLAGMTTRRATGAMVRQPTQLTARRLPTGIGPAGDGDIAVVPAHLGYGEAATAPTVVFDHQPRTARGRWRWPFLCGVGAAGAFAGAYFMTHSVPAVPQHIAKPRMAVVQSLPAAEPNEFALPAALPLPHLPESEVPNAVIPTLSANQVAAESRPGLKAKAPAPKVKSKSRASVVRKPVPKTTDHDDEPDVGF